MLAHRNWVRFFAPAGHPLPRCRDESPLRYASPPEAHMHVVVVGGTGFIGNARRPCRLTSNANVRGAFPERRRRTWP
jgi:hypothetical protein